VDLVLGQGQGGSLYFIKVQLNYASSALTLLIEWQEGHPACKKTEWWGAGVVICLERGADLHMAQLMPLPHTVSCFSKIQMGLPFWYRLTRAVPDNGPLNGCVCVQLKLKVMVWICMEVRGRGLDLIPGQSPGRG